VLLAPYLGVLEDPTGQLGIGELTGAVAAARFVPLGARSTSLGFSDSVWWVRFSLRNTDTVERRPVLRLAYPLLDHVEVWTSEGGRLLQHWRSGDRLPFSSRPIAHRDFLFPLQLGPGVEQVVYLRAESGGPVNLSLSLYPEHALVPQVAGELLALGALFGCVFLLATGLFVLWLFVRDAAFLHYLCYVLSFGSYMAVFNGIAYQYVWPDSPEFASVVQVLLLMAALFFLVQFSRSMLRIPLLAPRLDWVNRALQGLTLALMAAAPFFRYADLIMPISVATLWAMAMVLAMGVAAQRAGERSAGYYLLAWSVFLVGVVAYMLKSFGWLPHNFATQYGFQVGTFCEFVLLSVALGIRVQELRQQSRTDGLTGLANRTHYDALIEQQFAQHLAEHAPLSLLVVDVDHFQRINDSHGHAVGDRTLQRVADVLRRGLGRGQEACRYGGEEFAIVLPRCTLEQALDLAERLRAQVAADPREPPVTISVGVACTAGQAFADPRALFRAADEALYAAKRSGRDRVVRFGLEALPGGALLSP
jgi:two-component system, sensor histidine kinase LadS